MASPQLENGYTAISNEILEQLCKLPLNGSQFRIVFAVFRFTYGYKRKDASLSDSFLCQYISMESKQFRRELARLIDFNIIQVVSPATRKLSKVIRFNKDWHNWKFDRGLIRPEGYLAQRANHTRGLISPEGEGYLAPSIEINENHLNESSDEVLSDVMIDEGGEGYLAPQEINKDLKENSIKKTLCALPKNGNARSKSKENDDKPLAETDVDLFFDTISLPEGSYKQMNIKGLLNLSDIDSFFERIWKLYPVKKGKAAVSKSQKIKLSNRGFEVIETCIQRYIKTIPSWQEMQNGSTFFNTGYVDYLDENFSQTQIYNSKTRDLSDYDSASEQSGIDEEWD